MSISMQSMDFIWPNGHQIFTNLKLNLDGNKKHGLIGQNGVGKSTLVNLILGKEKPSLGVITLTSKVSIFYQSEVPPDISVGEYLIDIWTQTDTFEKSFISSMIETLNLESKCSNLSGGEWTKCRLLKILSEGSSFIIFDEPTNHLDRKSKDIIIDFVKHTKKGLLIASHDRELLEEVDLIHELSNQGVSSYGGSWSFYEKERRAENERQDYHYDKAQREKKKAKLAQQDKLEKQEKRMKSGRKYADSGSAPKILMNRRKGKAENTMGNVSRLTRKINEQKSRDVDFVIAQNKIDSQMYAQLQQPEVKGSKIIIEAKDLNFKLPDSEKNLWARSLDFVLRGPQKLAITGSNGSGKTTFLKQLLNLNTDWKPQGELKLGNLKMIYIDQQYEDLNLNKTVLETVFEDSGLSLEEVRNKLAMFLFQDEKVNQTLKTLSGGEKLRVSLAKAFTQKQTPELIVMDEPTNNLDLKNIEFLENFLKEFAGALIVVSHDLLFLKNIGVTSVLNLDEYV